MRQFSNRYMIIYSAVLVAVVAVVLSITAVALKPLQERNKEREQQQMILKAVGVDVPRQEVEKEYNRCIGQAYSDDSLMYYYYDFDNRDGIILPLRGTGLWGPIWGYLAIDKSGAIVGAVFDHKGETPGLGGEIASDKFAQQFIGKRITDSDGHVKPVRLKKSADHSSPFEVDAISGGTITSNGVNDMLAADLAKYKDLIEGGVQ